MDHEWNFMRQCYTVICWSMCHRHNGKLELRGIMGCRVKSYLESLNVWITDTLNHTLP